MKNAKAPSGNGEEIAALALAMTKRPAPPLILSGISFGFSLLLCVNLNPLAYPHATPILLFKFRTKPRRDCRAAYFVWAISDSLRKSICDILLMIFRILCDILKERRIRRNYYERDAG